MAIDVPFIGGVNVPLISKLLKSYTPATVSITYGDGFELNSGVDPSSWITIKPNSEKFKYIPSVDGGGARMLTSDLSATISVNLMQVSEVNRILFSLVNSDNGENLTSFTNFTFEEPDGQGGLSYLTARNCWISKIPDIDYSDKMGSITWEFTCTDLEVKQIDIGRAPVESV